MQTQTTTTQVAPSVTTQGYPIGTILHGNNVRVGNLWIINTDNSFEASLLFEGKTGRIIQDGLFKRDTMSPGMKVATPLDVSAKTFGATLPAWAKALILTGSQPAKTLLPKPSTVIPPQVMQQIQKQFATVTPQKKLGDLGLTKPKRESLYGFDDSYDLPHRDCPARKEGNCDYQPYYGFTDTYMYCVHCDHKTRMPK